MSLPASERLRLRRDEIVRRWMKAARRHVAAAHALDDDSFRDSLPDYLTHLAEALDAPVTDFARSAAISGEHARQRCAMPEYAIEDVLVEYRLLRKTLFDVLDEDGPLDARDRDILNEAIDCGISQAGAAFMHVRQARSEGDLAAMRQERLERENFVSMLSHDLRNPLNAARMAAQLILRKPDNAAIVRRMALKIVANVDRTDAMLGNLLDATRMRAGEALPLEIAACDLATVAQEVIDVLADGHGADRFLVSSSGETAGSWDASYLRRAIENLLSNALKYGAPDGRITIAIDASAAGEVKLSVHNEGPTIPPDEQASLFDRFRRGTAASHSGKRGWGLGLTLVRGVAEAHGGAIGVTSADGEGVTFTLTLPRHARAAAPQLEGAEANPGVR